MRKLILVLGVTLTLAATSDSMESLVNLVKQGNENAFNMGFLCDAVVGAVDVVVAVCANISKVNARDRNAIADRRVITFMSVVSFC